ncbi:hypothetical protein ZIOFF_072788 [Zingiber officinale]|uniref:Uncharacterized protein n=1 Tax=Zingiber officinale TaxID=94328 RepID=A0A8J5BWB3_ZINOF|nr:hypothetical protein ZIOFF_072788 [Zingiber officinale]
MGWLAAGAVAAGEQGRDNFILAPEQGLSSGSKLLGGTAMTSTAPMGDDGTRRSHLLVVSGSRCWTTAPRLPVGWPPLCGQWHTKKGAKPFSLCLTVAEGNKREEKKKENSDSNKLIGLNFWDWFQNLRIVLKAEKLAYVLDQPLPTSLDADVTTDQLFALQKHKDDSVLTSCIMLAAMTLEL